MGTYAITDSLIHSSACLDILLRWLGDLAIFADFRRMNEEYAINKMISETTDNLVSFYYSAAS
jgi:hypothetical protein